MNETHKRAMNNMKSELEYLGWQVEPIWEVGSLEASICGGQFTIYFTSVTDKWAVNIVEGDPADADIVASMETEWNEYDPAHPFFSQKCATDLDRIAKRLLQHRPWREEEECPLCAMIRDAEEGDSE